jgi:phosphatidate cytidylyltransferase
LPRAWLAGLVALLVVGAGFEWARLCKLSDAAAWTYGASAAAAFGVLYAMGQPAQRPAFGLAAIFWLVVAPLWLSRGVRPQARAALVPTGFVVIVPAALALAIVPGKEVLLVLILVWIADSAAYFVGRAWGRRKLAPSISPGKTWEGAAGGILGALAYAIICGSFLDGIAWPALVAGALVLAALSIVGDLLESAAKRQAEVKDSGALLPGHGGILDRIDSATAVLPVAGLLLSLPR